MKAFPLADRLPRSMTLFLERVGVLTLLLWEAAVCCVKGRVDGRRALAETASIGADSLPIVALICLIAGSVLALQTAEKFAQTGADAYVGGMVAIAIVREIAPIFTCLAVGARAGTAIASELANMQVTDQVAALQMMHVSPVRYLVAPKLIACVVSLPLLTLIGEGVGILGGAVLCRQVTKLHLPKYFDSIWLYLSPYDIQVSLLKAAIFGVILVAVCSTVGLSTRGGAREVGLATTKAAVWTAIAMIVADFFLTWIFFGTTYERNF